MSARSLACRRCALACTRTTVVDGVGPMPAPLLVVAEAPGEHEDQLGIPFVGLSGQLIRTVLGESGATADKVFITNVVKCRPPSNRDPSREELAECLPWLHEELRDVHPLVVLSLGRFARDQIADLLLAWDMEDGPRPLHYTARHPAWAMRQGAEARAKWTGEIRTAVHAAGLTDRSYLIHPPREVRPSVVDPWSEGLPDWTHPFLAADTETDDLTDDYGVKLVTAQYSDGQYAHLTYVPMEAGVHHLWLHNARYDLPLLGIDPYDLDAWDDTMLVAYVLRYPRLGLKELGPALTGIDMEPIKPMLERVEMVPVLTKTGKHSATKAGVPKFKRKVTKRSFSEALRDEPERARTYALKDAVVTSRLAACLHPMLEAEPRLNAYYHEIEKPLVPVLMKMEQHGVLIDTAQLDTIAAELEEAKARAEHEVRGWLDVGDDTPLNLNSGDQLAPHLKAFGLELRDRTSTGKTELAKDALLATCGVTAIEDLPNTPAGHLVRSLLEWRQMDKLRSTFAGKLPRLLDPQGRLHGRFNQSTSTSRLSSSDPNLQNIPNRMAVGKAIRKAFVAPPEHVIIKADYSQLELRVFAHYSQEPALVQAYQTGVDVHAATAAEIYDVPLGQVTSAQRSMAKNCNFLMLYGGGPDRLAATGGVSLATARAVLARVHQRMPSYARWPKAVAAQLERQGYVETLLGFRNYYPLYWSPLTFERSRALREAGNMPIQGTASGIVKRLMLEMDELCRSSYPDAHLILQVHDELVYEVPTHQSADFAQVLAAIGAGVGAEYLTVPLVLDVSSGPSWGDTH